MYLLTLLNASVSLAVCVLHCFRFNILRSINVVHTALNLFSNLFVKTCCTLLCMCAVLRLMRLFETNDLTMISVVFCVLSCDFCAVCIIILFCMVSKHMVFSVFKAVFCVILLVCMCCQVYVAINLYWSLALAATTLQ